MDNYKEYKTKLIAISKMKNNLLVANTVSKYFIEKSYDSLLDRIKKSNIKNFYEYIGKENNEGIVNLYFDLDISNKSLYFDKSTDLINIIKKKIKDIYIKYDIKWIILESHNEVKKSYHLISRIQKDNINYYFKNTNDIKIFIKNNFADLLNDKSIDTSVYRDGLFRTIYSSKENENRPLIKSILSDDFEDIETFVSYTIEPKDFLEIGKELIIDKKDKDKIKTNKKGLLEIDLSIIKNFLSDNYEQYDDDIRDIMLDEQLHCINIALHTKKCKFIKNNHKSNHQYIIIDSVSSKQKCHDTDCISKKYNIILYNDYPEDLKNIINRLFENNDKIINDATKACEIYVKENYDTEVKDLLFYEDESLFRGNASDEMSIIMKGKCQSCNIEHIIANNGYCIKCIVCNTMFPKNKLIPIDDKNVNKFWTFVNCNFNINITNEKIDLDDNLIDCKIDSLIFTDKTITKLINTSLKGHKVMQISKLLHHINDNFIYSKNKWYVFENTKWQNDDDNKELRKQIMELTIVYNKVKDYYFNTKSSKLSINIIKNIENLEIKLNKPGFMDEIIKGSKVFYDDKLFLSKLNSKKHLLPFENGVYDLVKNEFRKSTRDDYIELTCNYDYVNTIKNNDVYIFLEQILPIKGIRDYVLKKMSDCLNGDIQNTTFMMFIGESGANGKSQLLNLMKATLGSFADKVEVTLLTRKRNNANEANSEKIKLVNKRFAFLSEPEDGEKINIGLLKELTSSEEIVARGLYSESVSFRMEAKLFLACNELPEIKGEDSALWRRIRVIDFPSKFIDNPEKENEYKIDKTLPTKIREDITWRQTFMNILIEYYYKDVNEPEEIKIKTNEYKNTNNLYEVWFEENLLKTTEENDKIYLKDLCINYYNGKNVGVKEKGKFKLAMDKWMEQICKKTTEDGKSVQYWNKLKIID